MSHVVGIDIGTSGIKVAAMNREGVWGDVEYQPYSLLFPKKGWVEVDAEEIWSLTEMLLKKVVNKVLQHGTIDVISLSTFCNSSVFMDGKGKALCPGIMYLDQRSSEETTRIKEILGEERIVEVTGNRLEPGMYTVTTHLWCKNQQTDIYSKTEKWGPLSTFILHKLTGEFALDWTQASFSGLYDIRKYEWSAEFCEKLGIETDKLPRVYAPDAVVGNWKSTELSDLQIPVVAGAADTACSALALGIKPDEMFESVGTSNVLTVCVDDPSVLDRRFLNRCHVVEGQWLSHGAMSFPGAAIQWFYENFLKSEGFSKEVLNHLAEDSSIGANGVFFLPYMQGERSPIWDTNARGTFVGLHLNSNKADMYRAVLEGCSFGLRQIYEIVKADYQLSPESLQSIGGGAKNKAWAQIKANVLNVPIEIKGVSETAVLGACLIGGKAAGYYDSYEEASTHVVNETIEWVYPQPEEIQNYSELYKVYSELYPTLKPFFSLSNRIGKVHEEVKC